MTLSTSGCTAKFAAISIAASSLFTSSPVVGQQFVDQTVLRFPSEPIPGGEYTNQATVGDIDGDMDLDLIFANGGNFSTAGTPQQLRVYINNGAGTFTDESVARVGVSLFLARGVELGDIDGDNDLDMIVAQDFNRQPQLFTNNGSGVFTNVTVLQLPVMLLSSARGQFADVDNDGDLDIYLIHGGAVSRFGTDKGRLLINDGSGNFTDDTNARMPNETVIEPMDIIFGDLDGNFSLDIVIASRRTTAASTNAKRYINNGSGVFSASAMPSTKNNYSFDLGDFDGDGDLDLVGANAHPTSTNSELAARNGTTGSSGNFAPLSALPSSTPDDNDSKFFDYDNDGDLDLIIASLGSSERVYNNNGTGSYSLVGGVITAIADSTMDIEVADLNGDGRLDVITGQGESGSFVNRIYMNLAGPVDDRMPRIIKTEQVADALSNAGPFVVRAVIYDDVTSDRGFFDKGVVLNYSVAGALGPVQVPMKWMGNSIWRGTIPSQPTGSVIDYFVTANDYAGNMGTGSTMQFEIDFPPCPGDITGDHTVGVPDLLAVINAWGQSVVTHNVDLIGQDFVPDITNAKSGDTMNWTWVSGGTHTITSGTPCTSDGTFNQIISTGTFQYVIPAGFDGEIPYFCVPHCAFGMTAVINVAPFKEDVDQSGSVGVPDLLGVINGWGNCPVDPVK